MACRSKTSRIWAVLLVTAGLLGFAACDDGGDGASPTEPPATIAATPTSEASATATDEPGFTPSAAFEGTRGPVESPGGDETATLVDIRMGRHGGFDRVVFEFETARPGYSIEYIEPPAIQCGSGFEAEIRGAALLHVRMTPAAAHDDAGNPTFSPTEISISPTLPAVAELESTCDFEGIVTWVIGVNAEEDFQVTELGGPPRLVIDVLHP